ncbi:MAG: FAD binding domain-containing protein [Rubrivivax sp.]|nr:FAD binding domain-containing protein [Rubrivivax sp.]
MSLEADAGAFELLRPPTVREAAALLAREGARPLAGGTDLLPNLRRGIGSPRSLVDLSSLPGFDTVQEGSEGWRIGAGITLARLARQPLLAAALPALAEAAGSVAGPGHRSAATLGGNLCQDTRCIFYNQSAWWRAANGHCLKLAGDTCHVAPQGQRCHAAYEGDIAPALIALSASVSLVSVAGAEDDRQREVRRTLPLHALYRDDGAAHLTLGPHELLEAVFVPRPAPGVVSGYHKVRARAAMDFPLAGVAMSLGLAADGRIAALTVAVSGTNSQPLLLAGSAALVGALPDEAAAQALGKLVSRQVSPMRSTVTASHHRRLVAVVAAQRLLARLAGSAASAEHGR